MQHRIRSLYKIKSFDVGLYPTTTDHSTDRYERYLWLRLKQIAPLRTIIIKDFIKVVTASSTPFGVGLRH